MTGRGILLLRDRGLEEEEREGPSSPWRSEREPRRESSSCERSEAEDSWSLGREATMGARRSEREGEAVGEGTGPWWLALFCSSFSLAEPGGGGSSRLEGSSTGMRLSLRLGSLRGAAAGQEDP